jgi:hypothetical protein
MTFGQWVHELWLQNCDELLELNQTRYTQQEYFQKYKYWLKREYRHQQGVKNGS